MKIEYDLDNFYVYRDGKPPIVIPLTPEQKAALRLEFEASAKEALDLVLYGVHIRKDSLT